MLQSIGFGTIIFIVIYFVVIPLNRRKEYTKSQLDNKISKLRKAHPTIKSLFDNFESEQYKSANWSKENGSDRKGFYTIIFDSLIFVYNDWAIEDFKKSIIDEVSRIESNSEEKSKMGNYIKKYDEIENRFNELKESKYLEMESKYYKYKNILISIFPNSDVKLNKDELISLIITNLNITEEESNEIFNKLTDSESGIIFQDFKRNENKILHWYCETV